MEGVTTAIVLFIFACLAYPHLVKNRSQFYSALGLVLIAILLDAIAHMPRNGEGVLPHVMYVLAALVQILAILMLVLCVGGLTVGEFAGHVSETVNTIRRGGEDKPTLVPLRGETPKPRADRTADQPPRRTTPAGDDSAIPLE